MANKRRGPIQYESAEQIAFVRWADIEPHPFLPGKLGDYLHAVPNGGYMLPLKLAMKLKANGLRSGVPDLFLATPIWEHRWAGLYIEMKKQRQHFRSMAEANGALTDNQVLWHNRLTTAGYIVRTAYGWEEAREMCVGYLNHGV